MSPDKDYLALKTVLFGRENQLLQDLREVVSRHDEQVGSPQRLQESVCSIIAGALREAGHRDHDNLAQAIAPVIIAGIRQEIRNSRDEMVDALYPIMGRLTSAYVLSVFREFIENTNRRIEGSLTGRYIRLRLTSLFTGKSYAELLLRETEIFRVQEILLIDANRGILLDRWRSPHSFAEEETDSDTSGLRLGGMLAAINRFAAETLKASNQELRSIDLGHSQIYLRTTPKHLFAVRCAGLPSRKVLRVMDQAILAVLETYEPSLRAEDQQKLAEGRRQALVNLAERLAATLPAKQRAPVFAIAVFSIAALVLASWIGWAQWERVRTGRIYSAAIDAIEAYPDVAGYPINARIGHEPYKLLLTGLVPSEEAKLELEKRVANSLGGTIPLESTLVLIPTAKKVSDLHQLISSAVSRLGLLEKQLNASAAQSSLEETNTKLAIAAAQIEGLKNALGEKADAGHLEAFGTKLSEQKDILASLQRELSAPERRLDEWVSRNAIFFAEGTAFRDEGIASRQLAELKKLLDSTSVRVRILGFTDPSGISESNEQLGLNRAKTVAGELIKMGTPPERLLIVGRSKEALISNDKGPASSNRRVEFRLAFSQESP